MQLNNLHNLHYMHAIVQNLMFIGSVAGFFLLHIRTASEPYRSICEEAGKAFLTCYFFSIVLQAMRDDSDKVPSLLTDYILKGNLFSLIV